MTSKDRKTLFMRGKTDTVVPMQLLNKGKNEPISDSDGTVNFLARVNRCNVISKR